MFKYDAQDVVLYFSLKYNGNWEDIYNAIKVKEKINDEEYVLLKEKNKANYITLVDKDYPDNLKKSYRPPFVLYYYGNIDFLKEDSIAVVGAREYSKYAGEKCYDIVRDLAKQRIIISGMARGIDSIAHQSTIDARGRTIAVLGSGIENCYPYENRKLYEAIKDNHLLISEYPFDVEPKASNFPERNRIIATLCKALFLIEAKEHSGSMITVRFALDYGRDIYCLPHNVDGLHVCNKLIKDGAFLVETADDILENL